MIPATGTDLACFGYLASAQVTAVTAYPAANSGASVVQIFPSLAGDAPLTALTAWRLGSSVHLVSNRVGLDPAGQAVLDTLNTAAIIHRAGPVIADGMGTPQLTIVTDQAGTRTWFAWLGTAVDQLATVDLAPLSAARLAYIDCYRVIDSAAAAAITASRAPLLLNLGGDPLSDAVADAASDRQVVFVQTNLSEVDAGQAGQLAASLRARITAEMIVITLGRLGAIGYTAGGIHRASAPPVPVLHTHGAGAAFSGGLAHAYLTGATTRQALQAACEVGTAHCAAATADRIPRQRTDAKLIKENQP